MKRGVLKIDSLEILFSVVNHPIKITILIFIEENEGKNISFNELIECFSANRVILITSIWEMYNDHLLTKKDNMEGTLFVLTESAKELTKIMNKLDYWSKMHQFYGGI